MFLSPHGMVRTADPDDAPALLKAYRLAIPRAALLDPRREPVMPTQDELTEMLLGKEAAKGQFFTIEDLKGEIKGFCGLRGMNFEALFGEIILLFLNEEDTLTPLGADALAFLTDRAFGRMRLQKLLVTCLDAEKRLRQCLCAAGFVSAGRQRQVLYSGGCWRDLETLVCFRPEGG